jgi:hypothetical protein
MHTIHQALMDHMLWIIGRNTQTTIYNILRASVGGQILDVDAMRLIRLALHNDRRGIHLFNTYINYANTHDIIVDDEYEP